MHSIKNIFHREKKNIFRISRILASLFTLIFSFLFVARKRTKDRSMLVGIVIPNARGFAMLSSLDPPINLDNSPYKVEEILPRNEKRTRKPSRQKF